MRAGRRLILRTLLVFVLLVLAGGVLLPRINADRFGQRVKASLEQALGRQVEIGKVRLDLFNGPGFSVDGVVIHDDPAISLEPFVYVETLEARVSFLSVWAGRLEFSSLRMSNPSLNLSRREGGPWNFEHLLARGEAARSAAGGRLPDLQIRGGRINVRLGDTKSAFYLSDASIDVTPPGARGGEWRVRFDGEPARTDRPTRSFGRFAVRGRWRPDGPVDVSIELERSLLSDLVRLVHGHDVGVHGLLGLRLRLAGPPSAVEITGRAELGDIHRWDLLPPHTGAWPLDIGGRLDLAGQTLELHSSTSDGAPIPIALALRVSNYLKDPRWAVLARLDRFPLAPLLEVARHMGLVLPAEVTLAGTLTGAVGYSPATAIEGAFVAEQVAVTLPQTPPLALESAQLRLTGGAARLARSAFTAAEAAAAIQAEYDWGNRTLSASIISAGMPVSDATPAGARLLGPLPLVGECRKGVWRGEVDYNYAGGATGAWRGAFQLADAVFDVAGLAAPVEIDSARVALRPDGVTMDRIRGRSGEIEFSGEYRRVPGAEFPDQLRLGIPKLEAAGLERLLLPSLRRDESLLSRALRFGRTRVPAWLASRHAEAAVEIGSLALGETALEKVRAHLRWDGASLEATDVAARSGDGSLAGRLAANLRRPLPSYRLSGRFRNIHWSNGNWDGRGVLQTSGTGEDLLRNLRFEAAFKAGSFPLAADTEATGISGNCAFAMARGLPSFRFSALAMTVGEAAFKGQGGTGPDGRLYLDFSDGQRSLRLSGTLSPFQLARE
jgi:hypothetical protein